MTKSNSRRLESDVEDIEIEDLLQDSEFASEFDDGRELTALIRSLVEIRKNQHLKQSELAKRIGISQSSLSEFESGNHDPYFSSIQRYARALGMKFLPVLATRWAKDVTVQDIQVSAQPGIWSGSDFKVMKIAYESGGAQGQSYGKWRRTSQEPVLS